MHMFKQGRQRQVCKRAEPEIGMVERQLAGERIGHHHTEEAGARGGQHAVGRVLDGNYLFRARAEPGERGLVELWIRLDPADVVGADDAIKGLLRPSTPSDQI